MFNRKTSADNFKFKSMDTYAWDRKMGKKKKFRTVFERSELTYLSVELSVFNKRFDEKNWEAEIHLIAHKIDEKKSKFICEKTEEIEISKDENIFTYNFGWGNDERGKFWKAGEYKWEAYLDGT